MILPNECDDNWPTSTLLNCFSKSSSHRHELCIASFNLFFIEWYSSGVSIFLIIIHIFLCFTPFLISNADFQQSFLITVFGILLFGILLALKIRVKSIVGISPTMVQLFPPRYARWWRTKWVAICNKVYLSSGLTYYGRVIHDIPFLCNPIGYPNENAKTNFHKIFHLTKEPTTLPLKFGNL